MSTWNILVLTSEEELQEKVMDEFEDYEAFVEEMKTHLRKNGEEPFLVAGVGPGGTYLKHNEEVNNLVTQFDGIGTWFPGHLKEDGENTSPDVVYKEMKKRYEFNENFANRNEMEFFPTAFPGYNEKANICSDLERRIPRSTKLFRDMLHLSEKHGTTNRINIATWNAWVEGHQIEPGEFWGEDYGTDHLDIVKEFQSN